MKSLDEVIKAFEVCMDGSSISKDGNAYYYNCGGCPYADHECDPQCYGEDKVDALYYLKKFREQDKELGKAINEACNVEMKYCHLIEDLERNDPLSWDELKAMEGKPVWVEGRTMDDHDGDYKFWCIVGKTDKLDTYIHLREHGYSNWKSTYGDWWQAYRKERR